MKGSEIWERVCNMIKRTGNGKERGLVKASMGVGSTSRWRRVPASRT